MSREESAYWSFPVELSPREQAICKRLGRTGRLYPFLRRHRHELFDPELQAELVAMYSDSPRGRPPKPPALLAMVTLLQAYEGKSDAAAVEEAVFDRRWQMVLDGRDDGEPMFSQGVLVDFRDRLIRHGLDRRLMDKAVDLACKTGEFGFKQLRAALDSAPLWGAGRVEDTFNLIGHALRVVVECAAAVAELDREAVIAEAGLALLGGASLKAALDIDWDDSDQQRDALQRLLTEVDRVHRWLDRRLPEQRGLPPLREALDRLAVVVNQDLEPDPEAPGRMRIKRGTAKDRRISIEDGHMRHGRKSRTRLFNGFKRHILRDLDHGLILAVAVRPANEPEQDAAELMSAQLPDEVSAELHIDRGYLASPWVSELHANGARIVGKPWVARNRNGRYPKTAFHIDLERQQVTCPAGQTTVIRGRAAHFPGATCDTCAQRDKCTNAKMGRGRSVSIHPQEDFLQQLRSLRDTPVGRQQLRERCDVEHGLAHVCARQGPRARYLGVRKNEFDLRRAATIENLFVTDRLERLAA